MYLKFFISISLLALFFACSTPADEDNDIPANPTDITVPAPIHNNIQPSASFEKSSSSSSRIIVNLLGLINPSSDQPIELKADYEGGDYNFYLEEDGIVQGVLLNKVSSGNILKADIVFTVDNSGSMGQEADSVALGIIAFANYLTDQGLDAEFGCVGYSGSVNGGVNLTSALELEDFLSNRLYYNYGTYRTYGFAGPDSALLQEESYNWYSGSGENGVVAVLYADSLYSWRPGAQRVFVNFTDEPTQSSTYYNPVMNTAHMCSKLFGKASVHTVFSQDSSYYSWSETRERPWAMSECTGGTQIFIPDDASGLNLTTLPVAGALSNSYKIEFITASASGSHTVVITITDANADGKITYSEITY